jgi:hypothetical protein
LTGQLLRFHLGEVWKGASGLRAAIIRIDDDGRAGTLMLENGHEENVLWVQLTQAGLWALDASPRPAKTADELKELVLQKAALDPVCPPGWDIVIRPTGNGTWRADHIPPSPAAGSDCANYVGGIVRCFGLLFDLAK